MVGNGRICKLNGSLQTLNQWPVASSSSSSSMARSNIQSSSFILIYGRVQRLTSWPSIMDRVVDCRFQFGSKHWSTSSSPLSSFSPLFNIIAADIVLSNLIMDYFITLNALPLVAGNIDRDRCKRMRWMKWMNRQAKSNHGKSMTINKNKK